MAKFFGTQQPGVSPDDSPPDEKCYCTDICDNTISINLNKKLPDNVQAGTGEFTEQGMIRSIKLMFSVKRFRECSTWGSLELPDQDCFGGAVTNASSPLGTPTGGGLREASCNIRSRTLIRKILGSTDTGVCDDIPACWGNFDNDCGSIEDVGQCKQQCKISIRHARPRSEAFGEPQPPRAVEFRKECGDKDSGWKDTAEEAGLTSESEQGIIDILEDNSYFDNNDVVNEQFPATVPHGTTFGNDLAQALAAGGNDSSKAICGMLKQMQKNCESFAITLGGPGNPVQEFVSTELCCDCEEEEEG